MGNEMKIATSAAIAASTFFLAISAVEAADMRPAVTKAPPAPIAVPFAWTGFYIGGHAGGIWGRADTGGYTGPLFPAFATTTPGIPIVIVPALDDTLPGAGARSTSWLAGGQVGYNLQINQFVLGVEADASATGLRMTGSAIATRFAGSPVQQTVTLAATTDIDWMATLRGRLGLAMDRALFYVTGGGAAAGIDTNNVFTVVNGPAIFLPAGAFGSTTASSTTRLGWTVGGGIEWAFADAWSVAAEYRHSDFGRVGGRFVIPDGLGGVLATGATSTRVTTDQATLRLNYRFGATPVVARY